MDSVDPDRLDSFDQVFTAYYTLVIRYAERRLPNPFLAEEIATATFEAAWMKWIKDGSVVLPWLYRVAANKVNDHYRATSRRKAAEASLARNLDQQGTLGADSLDRLALSSALLKLNAREREVIMLTYWEDLGASEIAVVLDTSVANVWAILSRTRRKLQALMENPAEEPLHGKGG